MDEVRGVPIPRRFNTPRGEPIGVHQVFPGGLPFYFAIGPLDHRGFPEWSMFLIDYEFGIAELMPITLCYANNGNGVWRGNVVDGMPNDWFCYSVNTPEVAMLAWDYDPFLVYVDWYGGSSFSHGSDFVSFRRDHAQQVLEREAPQFLSEFCGQFVKESRDDR